MSVINQVHRLLECSIFTPTEADRLKGIIDARTISADEPDQRPTVSQAIDAVRAASYEIHDPGTSDHGRRIVHTTTPTGFGADWDLDGVLRTIRIAGSSRLAWINSDGRHTLRIDRGYAGIIDVEAVREGRLGAAAEAQRSDNETMAHAVEQVRKANR